ncbi:hypothetical protein FHD35_02445 [Escherichia coli]|nr:hypothetical protein [Escherichia coli]EEW4134091.1 hypothetical protein [Escherichia coli]EEW4138640.1 hypothetical protein [Escherichia coli]EEW4142614.1 hypothetical protein [Escherichia coli]EEW4149421.1 hypothetical protein [Escherichia coli]
MHLVCISGGLITEVYDDRNCKVGAVTMSKHPRHVNKPFSDGKTWHSTYNEALLSLITRKRISINL